MVAKATSWLRSAEQDMEGFDTEPAVKVNVAWFEPELTLTVAGMPNSASVQRKAMSAPPCGAEPLRRTVPETCWPTMARAGLNESSVGRTAEMPTVTDTLVPP
jgi:hypothetical protein